MSAADGDSQPGRVRILRVRLVGRRWRAGFLRDVFTRLAQEFGEETEVRVTSYLAANARMPLTDVDIFTEPTPHAKSRAYKVFMDALISSGYPARRLLTVKEAEAAAGAAGGEATA